MGLSIEYSILIPTYNGEKSLEILIDQLEVYFKEKGKTFELVLVDDASSDQTKEILRGQMALRSNMTCVFLDHNVGQQRALVYGLKHCRGDRLITMDDDLQHPVAEIDRLIERADLGADLVFGIYESREDVGLRQGGSYWIGKFFKIRFRDLGGLRVSSFRLIDRSLYLKISKTNPNRFIYFSAELIPFAQKIDNVKVARHTRRFGKSGYNAKKLIKLGGQLVIHYGLNRSKSNLKKRILMVGAGSCQINGILRLKALGMEVVVADYATHSMGKTLADIPVLADAFDPVAILECGRSFDVDAIITVGTDQPLLSVVKAAEALKLPRFINSKVAYEVTNKREMKEIFKRHGIPTVPFALIGPDFTADQLEHIQGPYVVKPLDSQGQRGIFLLETIDEIRSHFDKVLAFSREEVILVEAFYPNEEITVSGWVKDGLVIPLTITDRVTFEPEDHIGVCVSHEYPSKHQVQYGREILEITEHICRAFHIENGPIYFQMLVGSQGVKVNEIACRLGGAYEDVTIPWVTGVDVLDANIKGCLGLDVIIKPVSLGEKFFSTQLFFCHPGLIEVQTPIESLKSMPFILDAGYNFEVGQKVPITESASARAGFVIITGHSEEEVQDHIERVFDALKWLDPQGRNLIRRGRRNPRP